MEDFAKPRGKLVENISYSRLGISNRDQLPTISLEELYDKIVLGDSIDHIYQIGMVRGLCKFDPYHRSVKLEKCKLPYAYITGIRERHSKGEPIELNGYLHVDLDFKFDASSIGIELLKNSLSRDEYTKMVFTTPSGRGLKIIVETSNKDVSLYGNYLLGYFDYLHNNYGIAYQYMDRLSPYHMAFISYDPKAVMNKHSRLFSEYTPTVHHVSMNNVGLNYGNASGEISYPAINGLRQIS